MDCLLPDVTDAGGDLGDGPGAGGGRGGGGRVVRVPGVDVGLKFDLLERNFGILGV